MYLHRRRGAFLSGETSFQLNVTSAGAIPISGLTQPLFGQTAGSNALASILTASEANLFAKEYEVIINRSTAAQASLATSMLPAGVGGDAQPATIPEPTTSKLANNSFATSMQTVARIIGGRSGLGVTRQIFYVVLGGFITHDNQAPQIAQLLTQLEALGSNTSMPWRMTSMGINDQVTTFTASDFGRTLTITATARRCPAGKPPHRDRRRGSGQNIYGQYPVIGANQANDTAGRLIPTTAVERYAGTLARWFGLSDSQVREVFPNFANFGTNPYGLHGAGNSSLVGDDLLEGFTNCQRRNAR